jgi:hypothetical protein
MGDAMKVAVALLALATKLAVAQFVATNTIS